MKLLTVRLSTVHDVLVNYAYRDGLYTRFSFTNEGREVKRARLREKPEPADGTLLSVVLDDDEDWSRVYGWLNHDTGMMHVQFWGGTLLTALVFLAPAAFCVCAGLVLPFPTAARLYLLTPGAWLLYLCYRFGSQVYPLFCAQRLLKALRPGH